MSAGWNATQRELEILELRAERKRLRDIARRVADLPYFKNARMEALVRDARDALALSPAQPHASEKTGDGQS
jgi:hypothetical protein